MERKFIQIQGVRLSYLEKNAAQEKTIFLIHHNSGSAQAWRKQLSDSLFNHYRLIAFDLPGHGQSVLTDQDQDYFHLPIIAKIVAQAITQLAPNQQYVVAGVSLGTNIMAEMLQEEFKPCGMVMAGPSLVGKTSFTVSEMMQVGSDAGVLYTHDADPEVVNRYARQTSLSEDPEDFELVISDYHAVQKPFRSKIAECIATETYSDEIELLRRADIPLLVLFGEEDQIVNINYLNTAKLPLWQNRIYYLPKAGHLVPIDQPEAFNKLVVSFADEVLG